VLPQARKQPPWIQIWPGGQEAGQVTRWPQLLVTTPHLSAQVTASLAHPQVSGTPPPPQIRPCVLQFWQRAPPAPHASLVEPG
jgi:hypothetical protein